MRKIPAVLTAALLVVAVLVAVFAAGCGDSQSAQAGPTTPEGILNQAMAAAEPMENGTGQFDLSLALNGDTSQMPAEIAAMFSQPITVTGTVSASQEPLGVDLSMTASFAGQNLPLGMRLADQKMWLQFMGTWYELPAEAMEAMGSLSTATTMSRTTADSLMQVLKTAGIDPVTWLSGLKIVGEDDLDGIKAYHLAGNVDVNKLVTDVLKAMQDENLMKAIQEAIPGMEQGFTDMADLEMPTEQELQQVQSQLAAMFPLLSVDMWITKDGYQPRQMELNAKMVPPAEMDLDGITDITVKASFSMAPTDKPMTFSAPANPRPFTELEQALSGLEGLFSGALGGI